MELKKYYVRLRVETREEKLVAVQAPNRGAAEEWAYAQGEDDIEGGYAKYEVYHEKPFTDVLSDVYTFKEVLKDKITNTSQLRGTTYLVLDEVGEEL